jgi:hypothetical protein
MKEIMRLLYTICKGAILHYIGFSEYGYSRLSIDTVSADRLAAFL